MHFEFFPDGYTLSDILGTMRGDPASLFSLLILIAGLICVAAIRLYFLFSGRKHAKTPGDAEVTVPPEGMSSADAGFAMSGTCEEQDVTSLLLTLAVNGNIKIDQYKDKKFRIRALEAPSGGAGGLRELYDAVTVKDILNRQNSGIEREQGLVPLEKIYWKLGRGFDAARDSIVEKYKGENALFTGKTRALSLASGCIWFLTLFLASFLAAVHAQGESAAGMSRYGFPLAAALIWSGTTAVFLFAMVTSLRSRMRDLASDRIGGVLFSLLFYLLFTVIGAFFCSIEMTPLHTLAFLVCMIVCPFLFMIRKPMSESGRTLHRAADGLKKWIESPDQDRLRRFTRGDPMYMYRLLPYAFVFDAAEAWVSCFDGIDVPPLLTFTASYRAGDTGVPAEASGSFVSLFERAVRDIVEETSKYFNRNDD